LTEERLKLRVGTVSLAVIALAIVFFVFIFDRIEWGSHTRVRVYFHHVGSLREGAAFVVAGRNVGTIETIGLSPRGEPGPLNGDEGVVVTVAIESAMARRLDRSGDVFVASRGALSERYLELGPPQEGQAGTMLAEGDKLLGRDPPSLDRVLQRTWDNLTALGGFTADIKPELDALRAQVDELRGHFAAAGGNLDALIPGIERLGPLVDDASAISTEITQLRERGLGGEAGLAKLAEVVTHARAILAAGRVSLDKLDTSATTLRAGFEGMRSRLGAKGDQAIAAVELAIDHVRADIAKIDPMLAQIEAFNQRLARGEGSIMKLMHDPEFPEDAKELGKILKRQPWKIIGRPSN
jgi:ABC-type transporter Mla subunit MlaD